MNRMIEALNGFAAAWWEWTVASTWQGALLLLIVAAFLAAGRSLRPGLRYGLLLVVLAKLAVPPFFGVAYGFSDLLARTFSNEPAPALNTDVRVAVNTSSVPTTATSPAPAALARMAPQAPALTPLAWLLLLEAAGAAAILFLIARQWRKARQLLRAGVTGDDALQVRFHAAARAMKLRRTPRLCLSDGAGAPQSGGILRPFVMLPSWAATMPAEELEILLAHELAHVRRRDALANAFQAAAQALLWWNPAVWWLNRRIREEREFCCDDLVLSRGIAGGAAYSRTLVNVAERVSLPASSWAMAGMADNFGAIDRRVRRALEGGHGQRGWVRYCAPLVLLLAAGWVLPGATDEEVKAGAGAAVGPGDVEALAEAGIAPSWPMVKYSLEEFLDWGSGRPSSPKEDLSTPGNILIAVRGIQVDRNADLLLPDGRPLADWLSDAGGPGVGMAVEADWIPFGERFQELRESGQADFTHLSHGAVGKGGEIGATMPTALDWDSGGNTAVEYVALNVRMRPALISQDDGSPAIELDLNIGQTVVAESAGTKRKYEQTEASRKVRIDHAQFAQWVFFVADTKGSRASIVCLRPALANSAAAKAQPPAGTVSDAPDGTKVVEEEPVMAQDGSAGPEPEIAVPGLEYQIRNLNAEKISTNVVKPDTTVFEKVNMIFHSGHGGDTSIEANRLEHTTGSDSTGLAVWEGDVTAKFVEFTVQAERLEFNFNSGFLFFDADLELTDFGTVQAEQIRVDPVARRIDVLNGTVDEARLKAAFGENATNAARGEWLTLPFAVARQISVDAWIMEIDRDAELNLPRIERRISEDSAPVAAPAVQSEGEGSPQFLPTGTAGDEEWSLCQSDIMKLAEAGRAAVLYSTKLIAVVGQEVTTITTGADEPYKDGEKILFEFVGTKLEIFASAVASDSGAEGLNLNVAYRHTSRQEDLSVSHPQKRRPLQTGRPRNTSQEEVNVTSPVFESVATEYSFRMENFDEARWYYFMPARKGPRLELVALRLAIVRPVSAH